MKRFFVFLFLVSLLGAGVFVVWMNSGGGAAVELSDEEKEAALKSGAGAQAIEVATEPEEEPLPTMADLKVVTDPAQLSQWADRARAAREDAEGENRLFLTVLLADIERLRGNVTEARALATEGAEGLPTNSRARQVNAATILAEIVEEAGDGGLGAVLKNLGKVKTYKAELRAAVELDPANADARVAEVLVFAFAPFPVGNKKRAKELIEELGPYDEFRRDFWRATMKSVGDKDVEEALVAFRALETRNPGDPDVLYTIADLLGRLDRWQEAAAAFDELLGEPLTRQGYNALYQGAKAREKGEFDLERALEMLLRFERDDPVGELMPGMDRVTFHRGKVLEKLGRHAEAKAAYLEALELKPGEKRVEEGIERVEEKLLVPSGSAPGASSEG